MIGCIRHVAKPCVSTHSRLVVREVNAKRSISGNAAALPGGRARRLIDRRDGCAGSAASLQDRHVAATRNLTLDDETTLAWHWLAPANESQRLLLAKRRPSAIRTFPIVINRMRAREAVYANAGLVICGVALVDSALDAGGLAAAWPNEEDLRIRNTYRVRFEPAALNGGAVVSCRDWLPAEARQTRSALTERAGCRSGEATNE